MCTSSTDKACSRLRCGVLIVRVIAQGPGHGGVCANDGPSWFTHHASLKGTAPGLPKGGSLAGLREWRVRKCGTRVDVGWQEWIRAERDDAIPAGANGDGLLGIYGLDACGCEEVRLDAGGEWRFESAKRES